MFALVLGWPLARNLNRAMFYLGARGLGLLNYSSDRLSGEKIAVEMLVPSVGQPVIFDVGANEGTWIARILKKNKNAIVHAFEPQSELAAQISRKFPHVYMNNVAVGDQPGMLELFDYREGAGSQHATLVPRVIEDIHGGISRHSTVSVVRLDDYCREKEIGRIDFLKIDVEGYECRVLRGAAGLIRAKQVGVIQFEFNEMNIKERVLFKDFYDLLADAYSLHRLLPNGLLKIERYSPWLCEQFAFQNIVAIIRP